MGKSIYFLLLYFILVSTVTAQNIYHPWIVTGGSNYVDFNFPKNTFSESFDGDDIMGVSAPSMLKIGRFVKPYLSVEMLVSTVQLKVNRLNEIPLQEEISSTNLYKVSLQAEYRFANGKLLKESFFLDPYLYAGYSLSRINSKMYGGIPVGIGLNIWPLEYFGLTVQGSYEYVFNFDDYMHYSLGVVVRFGNMIDKDRDRTPDRYDACPEVYGLEKQNGCPDYDYDGVVDSIDKCPTEYGWAPSGGCPDFDKDGVPDKVDQCPCDPGPAERFGCPETMAYLDTPIEKIEIVTTEAVVPNDSFETPAVVPVILPEPEEIVPDKIEAIIPEAHEEITSDNLKETSSPQDTTAIDVLPPVVIETPLAVNENTNLAVNESIGEYLDYVRFKSNSAMLLAKSYQSLDEILNIMNQNSDQQFVIVGYTDDRGVTEYNRFLSQERAKSVKKYFVQKGFKSSSIEVRGFGEAHQGDPTQSGGEILNRRVEIYVK